MAEPALPGKSSVTDVSRLLARSTFYANVSELWQMASRLVLTPIVLGAIGLDGYGSWVLLFTLCSYGFMLSSGFGFVVSKLTAELDRRNDAALLAEAVGTGMAVLGGLGLVLLSALWMVSPSLLAWLNVPERLIPDALTALFFVGAAVEVRLIAGCALWVLSGLQRADLQYRLGMLGSMVEFVLAVILVSRGHGLPGLGVAFFVGESTAVAAAWPLCRKLRPGLAFSPLRASRRGVAQIAALSAQLQALLVFDQLLSQGIRLILSIFAGVSALGSFSLGERIVRMAATPASSILGPLLPAFAHLEAGGEQQRWSELFHRASRAVVVAAIVPLIFAAAFAAPILVAWTGRVDAQAVYTVRILAIARGVLLLTGVATASLRAAGTVRLEMTSSLAGGILALSGALLAAPLVGYLGIVIALACGRSAGAVRFLRRFSRQRGIDLRSYFSRLVRPAMLLGLVMAAVVAAASSLPLLSPGRSRWLVASELGILALAAGLASAVTVWFLILSAAERLSVRALVPSPLFGRLRLRQRRSL